MSDAHATLPAQCCDTCEFGREAVAMCVLRCRNPRSPRNGRPVDLDEYCPWWLARDAKPAVHVLLEGRPLCGFTRMLPGDWPEGHRWVGIEDGDPTCAGCRQAVAEINR